MKSKYILSSAVLALALASCSNEMEDATNVVQGVPLQITVDIANDETRALGINDTEFKDGDCIGIGYGSPINSPQLCTATYKDGTWILDEDIIITELTYICAYYPVQGFCNSQSGFSPALSLTPGTNHLLCWCVSVDKENPVAELKFLHKMARVQFDVTNPDSKPLKSISLNGPGIYEKGYTTYTYILGEPTTGIVTIENTAPSTDERQMIDALLIPNESSSEATVTLNYEDGTTYNATITLPRLIEGKFYRLPVTIANAEDNPGGETDANGHEYVDLGLPSGLKWATCNVGANAPEEYGDYFAWGETSTKENYYWSTYKWCNGTYNTLTKYNSNSDYGAVDNKTVLDPEDDAAHVNWGGTWRMPIPSEFEELKEHCTWTWDSMNGNNGYKVTGTNGNSIFLPAAGYRNDTYLRSDGSDGYYWSSTPNPSDPSYAYYLYFDSSNIYPSNRNIRYGGRSVRPVTE